MRILITNDDGAAAPGLSYLAQEVRGSFPNTVVAAPITECGGCGTSIRRQFEVGSRILSNQLPLKADHINALSASPAFLVLAACSGVLGFTPDLIISGINLGPNVGTTILHSGTVGAAVTAANIGKRALAVSLDDMYSAPYMGKTDVLHWETAAAITIPLIAWIAKAPNGTAFSVNVPNMSVSALKGVRPARLAQSYIPDFALAEDEDIPDGAPLQVYYNPNHEASDSDVSLLSTGHATITNLVPPVRSGYEVRSAAQLVERFLYEKRRSVQ